jgi:hypothetical protein
VSGRANELLVLRALFSKFVDKFIQHCRELFVSAVDLTLESRDELIVPLPISAQRFDPRQ